MGQCGSREQQSPINFDWFAPRWALPQATFYHDYDKLQGSIFIQQNGHSLSADVYGQGFGGVTYDGQFFEVVSINFHVHSEHTFLGKSYPMEAHITHKAADGAGRGLVIAVPFTWWAAPPLPPGATAQQYYYMGWGYCDSGYYAGWVAADALDFRTCAAKCDSESECKFFSLQQGITCSRYKTGPCTGRLAGRLGYVTYMKAPKTKKPFAFLGTGNCPTLSYAGYNAGEAGSFEQCSDICIKEVQCKFFTFKQGITCTRYSAAACAPNDQEDFLTFSKLVAPLFYNPVGAGRCVWGKYVTDVVVDLADCQGRCTQEDDCKFVAYSKPVNATLGSNCSRFWKAAGDCEDRIQGWDCYMTYEKFPLSTNPALAKLLGTKPLPDEGQRIKRPIPMPADVMTELVGGGLDGGTYFEYQGSLTTPPCTEEVTWLVRRTPLMFDEDQMKWLKISILRATSDFGNYRALMPLMGRQIKVRQAVKGTPGSSLPPPAPKGAGMSMPLGAEKTAQEAVGWANQAQGMTQAINGVNLRYGLQTVARSGVAMASTKRSLVPGGDSEAAQLLRMQAEAEEEAQRSLSVGGQAVQDEAETLPVRDDDVIN